MRNTVIKLFYILTLVIILLAGFIHGRGREDSYIRELEHTIELKNANHGRYRVEHGDTAIEVD